MEFRSQAQSFVRDSNWRRVVCSRLCIPIRGRPTVSLLTIPEYDISTESDVEQKFIMPVLTHPSFLEVPAKAILTKKSLRTVSFIDKSSLPKGYIPDYIVFINGYPVLVIEAKAPGVAIKQALDEARMYGQLLNQNFPTKINPVAFVMGCNGKEIAIGPTDTNDHEVFSVADVVIGSEALARLKELIGAASLSSVGNRVKSSLRARTYVTPAGRLSAQLFLDRVKPNALAPYLTPLYEMFFRAEDPEKIQLILDEAYVDTAELREYDLVLHSMLRQIERSSDHRAIQTDRHREYTLTPEIGRYDEREAIAGGRLHLIIGSRGAGKSLFVYRFFTHLMPEELKGRAAWCIIDFNRAPSSIENIENYICEKFVEQCQNLQFDPYSLDGLNRVFAVEINRLQRGPLAVVTDEAERQRILSTELLRMSADKRNFGVQLGRSLTSTATRPLVVALDNVDRRESAQQLQIFQAAQWFRRETHAFTLLTLRDVTFERFKGQPPLDAFAQISNFYVRPPRFALVLQKRLRLAISVGLKEVAEVEQTAASGMRFRYTKDLLGTFLQTVYDALFGGNQEVGRIVDALAERDVRDALGMFSRMLSSGHFNADRVISIGTGGRADGIKHDMLIKILMRADYRLYSDGAGFIRNLFGVPSERFGGNIFLVAEVLGFFAQPVQAGSGRIGGFLRLDELLSDMASMGFEEAEVRDAVHRLIEYKMLAYDGEDTEQPTDADLIKITPSGFIHLRSLPHFIEYLSSVALHSPFEDQSVAKRIADIWGRCSTYTDLGFIQKHEVVSELRDYLVREKRRLDAANPLFKERSREAEGVVAAVSSTVNATAPAADRLRARRAASGKPPKRSRQKPTTGKSRQTP
jgi:hypothetical protein